jgi:hypothetical protein
VPAREPTDDQIGISAVARVSARSHPFGHVSTVLSPSSAQSARLVSGTPRDHRRVIVEDRGPHRGPRVSPEPGSPSLFAFGGHNNARWAALVSSQVRAATMFGVIDDTLP